MKIDGMLSNCSGKRQAQVVSASTLVTDNYRTCLWSPPVVLGGMEVTEIAVLAQLVRL